MKGKLSEANNSFPSIKDLEFLNSNDVNKITTFTKHAKIIESPVAILCDFDLMKDDE